MGNNWSRVARLVEITTHRANDNTTTVRHYCIYIYNLQGGAT